RLRAGGRGQDAQVLRRERQRALVDDLADAGEQVLPGVGEPAPDDDDGRVDEVHHRRDDLADVAARLAQVLDGGEVARAGEVDDVLAGPGVDARLAQPAGDRGSGGDGLEAALVAAAAEHAV